MANGNGKRSALLAPWQPPTDGRGEPFALSKLKPSAKPFSSGDKAQDKAAMDAMATELDGLQYLFFCQQTLGSSAWATWKHARCGGAYQSAYEALLGATSTPWAP